MSKMSERRRLVLVVGATVLVLAGIGALVIMDRREIDRLREETAGFEQRIRAADVEIGRIPDREDDVLVYRAVQPQELAILPTEQRIVDFHQNLSTFMAKAGLAFEELPESRPEKSEMAAGVFVTRNQIRGRGTAQEVLRFLNMVENDPRLVAVKGMQMTAGNRERRPLAEGETPSDIEHGLHVHLETYFYEPPAGGPAGLAIPGAERRLQEPRLRQRIESFRPEKVRSYVLASAASRRDPLVDPRRARERVEDVDVVAERQRQEEPILQFEARWREVEELLEQERALQEAGDILRADHARDEIATRVNDLALHLAEAGRVRIATLPDLVERIDDLRAKVASELRQQPQATVVVTRTYAEQVAERMQTMFAEGNYKEVASRGTIWRSLLERREIHPSARPLLAEIDQTIERAKTLQDWSGFHFDISGMIVHGLRPEESLADINGRSYRVGDRLDMAGGEIAVAAIESGRVVFLFRGERLAVDGRGRHLGRAEEPAGAGTQARPAGGPGGAALQARPLGGLGEGRPAR